MPRHTRRNRRGAGLMSWAKKAHTFVKSKNGYSRALTYAHEKWGKPLIDKTYGSSATGKNYARVINAGIKVGLMRLRQNGYGLKRTGMGLRRTGMGLKRTGMGRRLKY